jgi:hypothetical protein
MPRICPRIRVNGSVEDIFSSVTRHRNRVAALIIGGILGSLAVVSATEQLLHAFGYQHSFLFYDPADLYADLIKSALSYKSVVGGLLHSSQIDTWPERYRNWLTVNPYDGPVLTHFHLMPLTTVFKLLAAEIIVVADPTSAYGVSLALYIVLIFAAMKIMSVTAQVQVFDRLALAVALLLSHPALFMLTRGNLASGYMSVFLVIYALTAISGKHRNLGLFCLAMAINIHPNTASAGILELACCRDGKQRSWSLLKIAVFTAIVGVVCFFTVHAIDPAYTVAGFFRGYGIYVRVYSEGDEGLTWNSSLFGLTKEIRAGLGLQPYYNATAYAVVFCTGLIVAAVALRLAWVGGLTKVETLFLGMSFYVLFTPVFAVYHMLDFAAPLFATVAERQNRPKINDSDRLVFVISLSGLCVLGAEHWNGIVHALVLFGAVLIILLKALRKPPFRHVE